MDVSSLQTALEANQRLQATLQQELDRVRCQIRSNRTDASSCMAQLASLCSMQKLPPQQQQNTTNSKSKKQKRPASFQPRLFELPDPSRPALPLNIRLHQRRFREWNDKETQLASELLASHSPQTTSDIESLGRRLAQELVANLSPLPGQERSELECQLFLRQQQSNPFSPEQLQQIQTEAAKGNEWKLIAEQLSTDAFSPTAFDCLQAYHRSNQPPKASRWTESEDQLLFHFVAAAGPQFVLGGKSALLQKLTQLLPNKTIRQILDRAERSLLNPCYIHEDWTPTEERRLAILMKVYNELPLASAHFARGHKSVVDKWDRSLNPQYSAKPFTKQEDEKLISTLRNNQGMPWVDLSRLHFPQRHPQRLLNRWSELASDEDLLNREQEQRFRKRTRRKKTTT